MLDVPPPDSTNVAVGSRADAPPMMTAPVTQIVTTARRRPCGPVAHLVHRMASGGESFVGDQVLLGKIIIIGRLELAAPNPSRQSGAFLHGQRIDADVLWGRR